MSCDVDNQLSDELSALKVKDTLIFEMLSGFGSEHFCWSDGL